MTHNIKVAVTTYKNYIIIEPQSFEQDADFTPVTAPGKIGSMLTNTKNRLGMSTEAVTLLSQLKESKDDLGDILMYEQSFGWLGNLYGLFHKDCTDLSPGSHVPEHQEIVNNPPQKAKEEIDNHVQ